MITHVTEKSFDKEVLQSDKPVVIDFWAPWCMPCLMMNPFYEEISKEMTNLKFVKINVEEEQGLGNEFLITGIPTVVVLNKGVEIGRFSGYRPKEDLAREIKEILIKAGL